MNFFARATVHLGPKAEVRMSPDGRQLTVIASNGKKQAIPLYRIDHLTIQPGRNSLLKTLVTIAHLQRPVTVVDGNGRILATLAPPHITERALPWAENLVSQIHSTAGGGYTDWLDVQRAHAASLVLRERQNRRPDFEHALNVVTRAMSRHMNPRTRERRIHELQTLLLGHVENYVARNRLLGVSIALADLGYGLKGDLQQLILLPAIRSYLRRLRESRSIGTTHLRGHYAEIRQDLDSRCTVHIRALNSHLRNTSIEQSDRHDRVQWMGGELDRLTPSDL